MFTSATSSSPPSITKEHENQTNNEKIVSIIEKYKERVSALPKKKSWAKHDLCRYQGFWYYQGFWRNSEASLSVELVMATQDDFEAKPTNILLASHPKSGTTWLKALAFAIVNRTKFKGPQTHPLLKTSPHVCVRFIESEFYLNNPNYTEDLISTHMAYTSLPGSVIASGCKIVYVCRNPSDVLVSFWHFMNRLRDASSPPIQLEDAFEGFISGVSPMGPWWDHVAGYRKASLERPEKVLFLQYEDMKKDVKNEATKLARFMGCPFTEEEEAEGTVEKMLQLCSFDELRKVKNTDNAPWRPQVQTNDVYFRKGEVGDSVNHLTFDMFQSLDAITREKLHGLDLSF